MTSPFELIDAAMYLASGQEDQASKTIEQLCNHLERAVRLYAAAYDACEYAHSEGFEWPVDPFSGLALTFANVGAADERLSVDLGTCHSCDPPHRIEITRDHALAAGTRSAETNVDLAQSEGCQSGPKGNAQNPPSRNHP